MTKQTAKKKAELLGHVIGTFESRKGSDGTKMHDVAWCRRCGDTLYANESVLYTIEGVNSSLALQRQCAGEGASKFARNR